LTSYFYCLLLPLLLLAFGCWLLAAACWLLAAGCLLSAAAAADAAAATTYVLLSTQPLLPLRSLLPLPLKSVLMLACAHAPVLQAAAEQAGSKNSGEFQATAETGSKDNGELQVNSRWISIDSRCLVQGLFGASSGASWKPLGASCYFWGAFCGFLGECLEENLERVFSSD